MYSQTDSEKTNFEEVELSNKDLEDLLEKAMMLNNREVCLRA
jgi:hypothetical protein